MARIGSMMAPLIITIVMINQLNAEDYIISLNLNKIN